MFRSHRVPRGPRAAGTRATELALEPLEDRLAPADLTGSLTRSYSRDLSVPDGPAGAWVGWDVDARSLPAGAVVTGVSVHHQVDHKRIGDLEARLSAGTGPTWMIRDNEGGARRNLNETRVDAAVLAGLAAGQVWRYQIRDTVKGTSGRLAQLDVTINYTYPAPPARGPRLVDTILSAATTRDGQTLTLGYQIANDGPAKAVTLNASLIGPTGQVVADAARAVTATAGAGTTWHYRTFRVNLPPGSGPGAYSVRWDASLADGTVLSATRAAALTVESPVAVRVPVLMYHRIDNGNDPDGTTPEALRSHILALKQYGYTFLTFTELMDIRAGLAAAPARPVVLTFDDGYLDFTTTVLPMLRELGAKATLFAFTEGVEYDRTNISTWDDLRALHASGLVDVQGHTVSHPHLTRLTDEQLRYELAESKRLLEQNLGKEIRYLSYPFGDYDARVQRAAWEAGYAGAVKAWGGVEGTAADKWAVNRVGVVRGTVIAYDPGQPDPFPY